MKKFKDEITNDFDRKKWSLFDDIWGNDPEFSLDIDTWDNIEKSTKKIVENIFNGDRYEYKYA